MCDHDLPEQVLAAARDDLTAFRPDRTPPFAALQARKRRRDARRGGAALAATALAVAGVAVVPSALTGGASTAPGPSQIAAGPVSDKVFRYSVGLDGPEARSKTSEDALDRCLSLPGLSDGVQLDSDPPQFSGKVTGQDPADAFVACVEDVPGRSVTLDQEVVSRPPGLQPKQRLSVTFERGTVFDQGFNGRQVDACLRLPGTSDVQMDYSMPPAYGVSVTGGQQLKAVQDCLGKVDGTIVKVVPQAGTLDRASPAEMTRYGVGVGWGDNPASYDDDAEAAVQRCFGEAGLEELSTLTSRPPYHSGKIIGKAAVDALKACVADGAPGATVFITPILTPEQRAFVESCVGAEKALPARDYEGLDERAATAAYGPDTRVVGRDGECLGRTRDLREDRVNLIVEDGKVIWAGRF